MKKTTTVRMSRRAMLQSTAMASAALLLQPLSNVCATPLLSSETTVHIQTQLMLGTFVTLTVACPSQTLAEEAIGQTFNRIAALEAELTRHQSTSPLAELNTSGHLYDAPHSLILVLEKARRIHNITNGAFDVTVAPLVQLYHEYQNPTGNMHIDSTALQEAHALVGTGHIALSQDRVHFDRSGMALTLDGIAKGFIADEASRLLSAHGITDHLVNAGGDIRASGQKNSQTPWQVAVENPLDKNKTVAVLPLHTAIATSGSTEVFYDAAKQHHHLIDPTRKQSPNHTLSVSVIAPTAMEADALATALSIMPTTDALQLINSLPQRECCLLTTDNRMMTSYGWNKV